MAGRVTGGHDRGEKVDRAQGDGDAIGEPGAGAAVPGCGAGGQGVADEALARPVAGGEVGQRNPAGGGVEAGLSAGPQPSDEGPRGVGAHADSRCGGRQVAIIISSIAVSSAVASIDRSEGLRGVVRRARAATVPSCVRATTFVLVLPMSMPQTTGVRPGDAFTLIIS